MSFPIAHSLRPAVRGLIAAILVAAFSAGPAPAETIRQQGGDVYSGSEGPWHLFRISMERGIRACSAYNFNHRRREPTISVIHFIEDGESGIGFQFNAQSPAPAGSKVTLVIADEAFKLVRNADAPDTAFTPETGGDLLQILLFLTNREVDRKKAFYVIDAAKKQYKFDARSTSRMLEKLETLCGG